ncbi:MAG TPA: urease accessory protein UreD [Ferruginibacter sp.]|nr:urease accessory protein UreD [Ferruginibacter sp.]HMP22334.1 urease accessory protein UreD [Ferruginibacter sp.]
MNAQLHIQVAERQGHSYLKNAFFTTPFKVADITENKKGGVLQLMLMSSSPGILDEDEYDIKIEVAQNCALQLHTQAYQRLFNMKQGARQQMNIHVADNASFFFLPHPSVPHEQSCFVSRNDFHLGHNSTLVFGEVLTCGRKLNGELFRFTKYHSISQVFIKNKLVIKENLLMQPTLIDVNDIGQLEGYTHQASMIWLQENTDIKKTQEAIIALLAAELNIEYGITAAPVNGLIVRLLGNGAEQLYALLHQIHICINNTRKVAMHT